MRQADSKAIKEFNVPSVVLMENAARSATDIIINILNGAKINSPKIMIFCGSGNNGGDGFAIARHLGNYIENTKSYDSKQTGKDNVDSSVNLKVLDENNFSGKLQIEVFWIGSQDKMSPETFTNLKSVESLGISISQINRVNELESIDWHCDCLIDALIGVGGTENIHGIAADILNKMKDNYALKIAVDMPTGLNSKSGKAYKDCFKAGHTITMFAPKLGMYLNDGPDYCGKIHTAYLGVSDNIVKNIAGNFILENGDIKIILPERRRSSSKFDYGRVLVIAGSNLYPGASALCSNAAIITGAGLVHLLTTTFHPAILPEVIPHIVESTNEGTISLKNLDNIIEESEKADSVIIGPGMGNVPETIKLVKEIINRINSQKPVLIDADALKAIDFHTELRNNIVLTPHIGEFAGISGKKRTIIENDTYSEAKALANKLGCKILLKSVPSIITDGNKTYININGNLRYQSK